MRFEFHINKLYHNLKNNGKDYQIIKG